MSKSQISPISLPERIETVLHIFTRIKVVQYDGYIYQGPFSTYEGVTVIKDFVNEDNLEQARAQSPSPKFRHATIEDFYKSALDDANVPQRLPKYK